MPRRPRRIPIGKPAHIVQRGVNRHSTFRQPKDFRAYLAALLETSEHYDVSIHAFVLMINHVHILARSTRLHAISRMMQQLGRKYVRYFNHEHDRTGTLWEGRFRSSVIDSDRYLFACYRYIEMNPVRAGLVPMPGQYIWSSYRANAMSRPSRLLKPHELWIGLGATTEERCRRYRRIFDDVVFDQDEKIRHALIKGRTLR